MHPEPSRPTQARALIAALAKRDLLEVRRVEIVARDFAAHVEALDRAPSVRELERWLESHKQVTEISASDDALESLLGEFLAPPKPPPATVRNRDLEKLIWQAEDDEKTAQAVAVYADWLQERNDPFGEQLALGLGDEERFQQYLRTNAERILGPHHRELARLGLVWRHGLIDKIRDVAGSWHDYHPVDPEAWASLLTTRSCEMIRELIFHHSLDQHLDDTITEYASPGLMSVIFSNPNRVPRLARRPTYNVTITSIVLELEEDVFHPEVEQLRLYVHDLRFSKPLCWPRVRRLVVSGWPAVARALERIEMPSLEEINVEGGDPSAFAHFPQFVASP